MSNLDLERNPSQIIDFAIGKTHLLSLYFDISFSFSFSFPYIFLFSLSLPKKSQRLSLHIPMFNLISNLSAAVNWDGVTDENWIRMIPSLIQILLLSSPQDADDPHFKINPAQVSGLIHQIVLKITDPSHLNLPIHYNDHDHDQAAERNLDTINLVTFFDITLSPPEASLLISSEMRVEITRHLQTISSSLSSERKL